MSVQSTPGSKNKTAKNPLTFFTQIIVVYMIIITSLVQISLRSPDKELWLILLSSSIGYILPSPRLNSENNHLCLLQVTNSILQKLNHERFLFDITQ